MLLLIAGAALALQVPTPDGDWLEISRSDGSVISLDRASIRRSGDVAAVRTRFIYATPLANGSAQSYFDADVDCSARTLTMTGFLSYDRDGRVLRRGTVPVGERRPTTVAPGTHGTAVLAIVCR